jgi:hypothetical protein
LRRLPSPGQPIQVDVAACQNHCNTRSGNPPFQNGRERNGTGGFYHQLQAVKDLPHGGYDGIFSDRDNVIDELTSNPQRARRQGTAKTISDRGRRQLWLQYAARPRARGIIRSRGLNTHNPHTWPPVAGRNGSPRQQATATNRHQHNRRRVKGVSHL